MIRQCLTCLALFAVIACPGFASAQDNLLKSVRKEDKFRQLEEILPTPNEARTASGAPGQGYWQQRADHDISVELDDEKQKIIGSETIRYTNNSPDTLTYLWLQLDPNLFRPDSDAVTTQTTQSDIKGLSLGQLKNTLIRQAFNGGVNITSVRDAKDKKLKHTIVKTMMRVDLPKPLKTGESFAFKVDWNYLINNSRVVGGRTGYEYFKEDDNYLYEIAQWFPRMASYTDVNGWQHKQYLGRGEFTLEFGDYTVRITVPADHVVAATGVLQNPKEVLTKTQQERLAKSKTAKTPMYIVTPDEAKAAVKKKSKEKKTWVFAAKNVRDFAFATSRRFIWDAQGHNVNGNDVMAMSFYPNEGEPLWSKYSTHAIIHTLNVYSRYTFDYPYPVAISVNGPVGGMEYPMICFNGPRPNKDGSYSKRTKYALISVIIHEVGHNYFPMIVNSDERQWTWMDEGLNTFMQFLTEQEWEENYPSRRGEPKDIVTYMRSTNRVPIMTNSESLLQFGPNAYSKPATALNILRETILGRELFDYSFKEYARRWKFKRPQPADFFRTMEDASGVDLDWFWRGWFYSTDRVDISIESVRVLNVDTKNPDIEKSLAREQANKEPVTKSQERNKGIKTRLDEFPELKDKYNDEDEFAVTEAERKQFKKFLEGLSKEEREILKAKRNFYVMDFKNIGGIVMPIILKLEFEDGTSEIVRIPVEVWRYNSEEVSKMIITEKKIQSVTVDPNLETADTELENNYFPRRIIPSRFDLFQSQRGGFSGRRPPTKRGS